MKVEGRIVISIEQVGKAVQGVKLRKSPGLDRIHPELIRYLSLKVFEMLQKLVERCLNGEKIPEEWR